MATGQRICVIAAFLIVTAPIVAQKPAGTTASFQSGNKAVAVERYDPAEKGSHPAVLVIHGAGGPGGGWRDSGIVRALTTAGYSVFVPHYFDAAGPWDNSGAGEKFYSYIRTVTDAVRYAGQQPGIRPDGVALVGYSLGGILVLAVAEETISHPPPQPVPPIKAVVENYGKMPEFAAGRMTTMPPVLILHGEKDELVPVSEAYTVEKVLKAKSVPYEMKIYPGQGHGFRGPAEDDAVRRAVEFLKSHLAPNSEKHP